MKIGNTYTDLQYYLDVNLQGAAFDDTPQYEIARILRVLADEIETRSTPEASVTYPVHDANGNTCGVNGYREGSI